MKQFIIKLQIILEQWTKVMSAKNTTTEKINFDGNNPFQFIYKQFLHEMKAKADFNAL
jgi:hypothetical protein